MKIIAFDAVSQTQLGQELTELEESGTVVSVSIMKAWEGWHEKKQVRRMDAIVVFRPDREKNQ